MTRERKTLCCSLCTVHGVIEGPVRDLVKIGCLVLSQTLNDKGEENTVTVCTVHGVIEGPVRDLVKIGCLVLSQTLNDKGEENTLLVLQSVHSAWCYRRPCKRSC